MQRVEVLSSIKDSLYEMMFGFLKAGEIAVTELGWHLLDGGENSDFVKGILPFLFGQFSHFYLHKNNGLVNEFLEVL